VWWIRLLPVERGRIALAGFAHAIFGTSRTLAAGPIPVDPRSALRQPERLGCYADASPAAINMPPHWRSVSAARASPR
jgi:hypothetical protein